MPWASVGGTEHATLRIVEAVADDYHSTAFCLDDAAPVRRAFDEAGVVTCSYRAVEPSYRRPYNYLRAAQGLAREFKSRDIRLVHCADVLAAHYTSLAGWLAGVPVVCHVRNRNDCLSRREQSFLRPVDHFVFVSEDTRRHFAYTMGARRGTVLYDGIDANTVDTDEDAVEARRELGIAPDAPVIGMVARVAPQKDYDTLARAARRIVERHPRACFLIIGDHTQEPAHRAHYAEVRQMLAANNVAAHFHFAGFRRDVRRMINLMNVFVLVTHYEGLPLVLLEAMACTKPVIATAVDGIPELIADGDTGLLFPHKDDAALAAHVTALLDDRERAARLGARAREHIRLRFSRERFAADLRNLYGKILAAPLN